MLTYAVQHPDMSHALIIESEVPMRERGLKARASMFVLKNWDFVLDLDEFEVREVPNDTDVEYSIFAEAETE